MGKVLRVLSKGLMPPQMWGGLQRFVAAENMHLYWRNFRVAMPFRVFEDAAKRFSAGLFRWIKLGKPEGAEVVLLNNSIAEKPRQTEIVVEENEGGAIHVHYGDVRIEFSNDGFLAFCNALQEAATVLVTSELT